MKERFHAMVESLCACNEVERAPIESAIWETFGVERAVLALDMSHFSVSVRRSGILNFLGLIRRMQLVTRPVVEQHQGVVVEFHADNLMAVFPDASHAVEAAVQINRLLNADRGPDGKPVIEVAIGIDFGRFLFVENERCFGDTVNTAFKLGEDIAQAGEILLTDAARARLAPSFPHVLASQPVSVSGMHLSTYSVQYPRP